MLERFEYLWEASISVLWPLGFARRSNPSLSDTCEPLKTKIKLSKQGLDILSFRQFIGHVFRSPSMEREGCRVGSDKGAVP